MKILSNIISHPEKDVYRRLRVSNRFVADLLAVKYAEDFFKVCGFVRTSLPVSQNPPNVEAALPPNSETDEGSGPAAPMAEDFLILPASSTEDLTHLKSMLELLETAQPIVPLVFRDTTVLQAAGTRVRALTRDELPADFFTVSREDLRRLMDQQQKAMEESGMLLTKAMRERLKTRERRLYRFVLIRIRLPGELVLQGTFQASETLDDVRAWVLDCLDNQAVVFKLWSPPGVPGLGRSPTARVALEDGFASLVDLGLAPCSLLTLSFEGDLPGSSSVGGSQTAMAANLRPDLLDRVQPLS
uniref:UBX domain-containing protein 6 n=2 Tax=Schistocephalus solidus TaxID=70667 RepID=A0A0X3NVX7_SCHSO